MRSISIWAIFVTAIISAVSANAYIGDQVADLIAKSESGNADAQRELSSLYYAGHHLDKDDAKARYWLKLAAENGDVSAQYIMYENYKRGMLFPQDVEKAIHWCRQAANQGYEVAECALGNAYSSGYGVEKDAKKAAALFKRSADKDYAQAQLMLGMAYLNGEGVSQDMAQAFKWLSIFHFLNDADEDGQKKFIAFTKEFMSEEQIAEGKALAAEWIKAR